MDGLDHANEMKLLQRGIADLASVLALPALCVGGDASQIVRNVLDVLAGTLQLDLAYVRLREALDMPESEMVRFAQPALRVLAARELGELLEGAWGDDARQWPSRSCLRLDAVELTTVRMWLGLQGELGVIVAGVRRPSFPRQIEQVLLNVVANQAVIMLREARLLHEQRWLAHELERRVVERTQQLARASDDLKREIAERKLIEARLRDEKRELKRSDALLAETQRICATGSFLWNVASGTITWSSESYRIFQLDRAQTPTLDFIERCVHPEERAQLREQMERAQSGVSELNFELRLQLQGDASKYIQIVARAGRDDGGGFEYVGAVSDVTERRRSEEALAEARSALARTARVTSLGVLTASIAHEVNQPLSGIITNVGTCLRLLAAEPLDLNAVRAIAGRALRDGKRAAAVIERLHALFSNRDCSSDPVDLNEATQGVIAVSVAELQRARVSVRLELADELPAVSGDRVQLQQVILNLLSNAAAAMSGIEDRPRQLSIRTERDGHDRVRLTMRDTGVGLDLPNLERLFEPFYTTKRAGMGIGLSISRSIIEQHHGRLWAAPNDGPGACFVFSIPMRVGAPAI